MDYFHFIFWLVVFGGLVFALAYTMFCLSRGRRDRDDLAFCLGHMREASDEAACGVVLFDENRQLRFVNESARRLMPFLERLDTGGHSVTLFDCLDYFGERAREAYQKLGGEVWSNMPEGALGGFQEIIMAPDGGYFLARVRGLSGGSKAIILSDYDLVLKTAEYGDEFVQADKIDALAKLAAGLAHDFNNVLSIVDGYTRLAGKEGLSFEAAGEYLKKISNAAQRGAQLTHKMMVFSQYQVDTNSVIDLADVVERYKEYLLSNLPSNIRAIVRADLLGAYVRTMDDAIVQIIQPVIENAVEAMPGGGLLTVDVSEKYVADVPFRGGEAESYVCLTVTDTGDGMAASVVKRVFDPFFTTKDSGQKSGLGLSVVYGLVQQLGGRIYIRSTPGGGTDVEMYFPKSAEGVSRSIQGDAMDPESIRMDGYTVLVVDDEEDLLRVIFPMLEDMGVTAFTVHHGNEALLFQEEYDGKIDVLLTDIVMADINGVKLAAMMQSIDESLDVVFMSGYPGHGMTGDRKIPDGADFIAKPLYYNDLAVTLYRHFTGDYVQGHIAGGTWTDKEEVANV